MAAFKIDSRIRFVDVGLYERINYLLEKYTFSDTVIEKKLSDLTKLLMVSNSHKQKVREVLQKVENILLKKSKYNIVIRNIPRYATSACDNNNVFVSHAAIRDTMNQFGHVNSLSLKYGVAYISMENNIETHNMINNMQLGKNIISTEVV